MFKDLAIVIHTMDKYEFCWDGWYKTFSKYWDFNLDIDIYFTNERKDVNYPGIKQLKTDIGEFSDRLNRAFNMIPHNHVMYWQEDAWMLNKLNDIKQYYTDFVKYDMDYLSFIISQIYNPTGYFKYHKYQKHSGYLRFNVEKTPFVIFHQPTIWKKDFFLKYLQHSENPWDNEIEGTKRAKIDHQEKEINIYNVETLDMWYTGVSRKGKLSTWSQDILNDTYIHPIKQ